MSKPVPILVCFAVREESKPFCRHAPPALLWQLVITGMGRRNAGQTLRGALAKQNARFVVSSGFAGGLNPELEAGTVVFEAKADTPLTQALQTAGARLVRFHCAERILATATAKREAWRSTGADAVEMESAAIREICLEQDVPCATVRVISDAADEDLPLDFNLVMTPNLTLDYLKLAWILARAPAKLAALWKFRQRINHHGEKLASVLAQALKTTFLRG